MSELPVNTLSARNLGHIIKFPIDVKQGAAWLAKVEPRFAGLLQQTGPLPLRLKPPGFKGLLDIIMSQQVSVASADAIRFRMDAAGLNDAATVIAAGEDGLRAAGLSSPKIRYALILANEDVDYHALRQMPDDVAIARLTAITGVGPWTAQIYVMFCMGRADVFPSGDLALQVAAQHLFRLDARPRAQELETLAQDWSPWRSVAARALFAYYRILKNREGLG